MFLKLLLSFMFYVHLCIIDHEHGNTYHQMKKLGLHRHIKIKKKNYNWSMLAFWEERQYEKQEEKITCNK